MKIPSLKINNRKIGANFPPLIIVELGINHAGNLSLAKKLILSAKKAGAEIIKGQSHLPNYEMSEEAKKIYPSNANKKSIFDVITSNSLTYENEKKIKKFVNKKNMIFINSPFSREAAYNLNNLKVPAFKIGSGECNNYPLVEYICQFKKPIILSTGMNSIRDVKKTVAIIEKYKVPYALMHCTNIYPTPTNLVRLNAMTELKKNFPKAVIGLSDHTPDNFTSFAAIAMGASIIEKHFVDDKKKRVGPDIEASIDQKQLFDLIKGSKEIYLAKPGKKVPIKQENNTMRFAFASVVSIKEIKKGEKLTHKNIWVKRPGTGYFKASDFKKLIGKKALKNIKTNRQIKKTDI